MPDPVERAAALLIEAYRSGKPIAKRPKDAGLDSREDVFAIQDRVAAALGHVGGWKVGASAPDAEPTVAPLPASLIGPAPAALPASRFGSIGVEVELAFRFAHGLPPRSTAYEPDEVLDAVESLHPAIEVVDSRLGKWGAKDDLWKMADNQSNGFFLYGHAVEGWRDADLAHAPVELVIDGKVEVSHDDGGNAAGDPRWLLVWIANHCAGMRGGLDAGAIVTTGSCTGLVSVKSGAKVAGRFPGLGEASVMFTG